MLGDWIENVSQTSVVLGEETGFFNFDGQIQQQTHIQIQSATTKKSHIHPFSWHIGHGVLGAASLYTHINIPGKYRTNYSTNLTTGCIIDSLIGISNLKTVWLCSFWFRRNPPRKTDRIFGQLLSFSLCLKLPSKILRKTVITWSLPPQKFDLPFRPNQQLGFPHSIFPNAASAVSQTRNQSSSAHQGWKVVLRGSGSSWGNL